MTTTPIPQRMQSYIQGEPNKLSRIYENGQEETNDENTSIYSMNSSKKGGTPQKENKGEEQIHILKVKRKRRCGCNQWTILKRGGEKMGKRIRTILERLFGVQHETLEYRSASLALMFLSVACGILLDIFILIKYLRGNPWYVGVIFLIASSVSFSTIIVFRISMCIKPLKKYANTIAYLQLIVLAGGFLCINIITSGNMLIASGVMIFAVMIPVVGSVTNAHPTARIAGGILFILLQLMVIHDLVIFKPFPTNFKDYALLLISSYLVFFAFGLYTYVLIESYVTTLKKQLNVAGVVADGIAKLELNGKRITQLKTTNNKDLSQLEIALKTVIYNVIAYKEYLPETMLVGFDDSQKDEVDTIVESNSRPATVTSSDVQSITSSYKHHESIHKYKHQQTKKKNNIKIRQFQVGLKKKQISMLMVDIIGFHTMAQQLHADVLVNVHSSYLELVNHSIKSHGGVIQGCYGDKVVATWNASRISLDKATDACNCAIAIQQGIKRLNKSLKANKQIHICIAVTTGESLSGHIGITGLKHFANIGVVVNRLFELIKLNTTYQSQILIDQETSKVMKPLFVIQAADYTTLKTDAQPSLLFELLHKKKIQSDEWFYELRDLDAQDFLKPFNNAFQALVDEKINQASTLLNQFITHCQNTKSSYLLYNKHHVNHLSQLLARTAS